MKNGFGLGVGMLMLGVLASSIATSTMVKFGVIKFPVAAAAEIRRPADPEDRTEILSGGVGNGDAVQELRDKVNVWLKEHHGKVIVKSIAPSGDNRWAMVVIWYTPKTD